MLHESSIPVAAARALLRLTWQLSERAWWLAARAALATWRTLRAVAHAAFTDDAAPMPDPMPDARPFVPATAAVTQIAPHGWLLTPPAPPPSVAEATGPSPEAEAEDDVALLAAFTLAEQLKLYRLRAQYKKGAPA